MSDLLDDYPEMFDDRCNVHAKPAASRGGSRVDPPLTASGVPCSYQPGYGKGDILDGSVPDDSQGSVFFGRDPGRLPTDSKIVVIAKDGGTLDVPISLNVSQLVSARLEGVAIFRADCTGRA